MPIKGNPFLEHKNPFKLKPCPFCGSTAQRLTKTPFYNLPQFQGRRAIICMTCHCIVLGNTEEDAEKIWNRRADNDR